MIGNTTTDEGLRIQVQFDENTYEAGWMRQHWTRLSRSHFTGAPNTKPSSSVGSKMPPSCTTRGKIHRRDIADGVERESGLREYG